MSAIQTHQFEKTLLLKLGTSPISGLLPADVVVRYRKQGQLTLQTKTIDGTNFIEIGDGLYILKFSTSDMDTLGSFYFDIDGDAIDLQSDEFSIEPLPPDLALIPANKCAVSGVVRDAAGEPIKNVTVTFKALEFPYENNMSIVGDSLVVARTDSQGYFNQELIRNIKVLVEIERTGVRAQITIPDQSTALINDLLIFPN